MFQFFLLWGINLLATQFNRQAHKRRTTRKFKAPIDMALKMSPTVDYGVVLRRVMYRPHL